MQRHDAQHYLKIALADTEAEFRAGQWEAIDALVNKNQKLLVVQRTGWGKSSVYFISAKIFRERGLGLTIIVSPLLALMRNQIESAERLGIKAVTLNSTNKEYAQDITQQILQNQIDCLLISPEKLSNDEFIETVIQPIADSIALIVVDEAHCISDWGHDFRPDYRRIVSILRQLPPNTPVLGTTATANNRVINDIKKQLGDITIQRGPLIRESLALQNLHLPDQASRLAWLKKVLPTLEGTGIIYTLTTRDAEQVANWLTQNNINAKAYHGSIAHPDFADSDSYRQYLEECLKNNHLKALVATSALGMGYDKPDLRFVIHYQAPGSIVAYYQQVGRAGRGVPAAFGILMSGTEDENIHAFFRNSSFPSLVSINEILDALVEFDGLTLRGIEEQTNLRQGQIEKVLKLLSVENPAPVLKVGGQWRRTSVPFQLDQQRIDHLTHQREEEWGQVQRYMHEKSCLMIFLRHALDDNDPLPCGKCAACLQESLMDTHINPEDLHQAAGFLKRAELILLPKKQVAAGAFIEYGFKGNLPRNLQAQQGRVLSRWGDAGWGATIAADKKNHHFRGELVTASSQMLRERWKPEHFPAWVCCVPSLTNPHLVQDFAKRLATDLGLPFISAVKKITANQPQKAQQNRFHQCRNLDGIFTIQQPIPNGSVLLIDDIVDSGWTLTVIAALLQQAGSGLVYPLALASTSVKG